MARTVYFSVSPLWPDAVFGEALPPIAAMEGPKGKDLYEKLLARRTTKYAHAVEAGASEGWPALGTEGELGHFVGGASFLDGWLRADVVVYVVDRGPPATMTEAWSRYLDLLDPR